MVRAALVGLSLALAAPAAASPGAAAPSQLSADGRGAMRALLEARSHPDLAWPDFRALGDEVEQFYRDRGHGLGWLRSSRPTRQALAAVEILRRASAKGLEPADYDGERWPERIAALEQPAPPPSEAALVRLDVALTVSVLRYLSDVRFGRVEPRRVQFELDPAERGELSDLLGQLASAGDVASAVDAVEPPFAAYRRTLQALATYSELADRDDGELLPVPRRPIRAGDPYAGAARLSRLLRLVGDLPAGPGEAESGVYGPALWAAVSRFQGRHGLEPDGQLGARTVEQLNRPLAGRVTQLRLTLERWRWLPRRFEAPPIVVNIPEFRLHGGDPGQRWSMRVVVGKAYRHRTPVFAADMRYVVFRPYWNVPVQIQREELAPRIAADPRHVAEKGYEIVDRGWRPVPAPASGAELAQLLRSGGYRIRQRPGPRNALGLVKFVLPNRHDVYLHDTPSPELFSRSRRDFSHGCIRVEDPAKLAAWVLRREAGWGPDRIAAATRGRETVQVNLSRPVPVLILYGTAFVTEGGEVRFFEDIYGHDAALERALAERRPFTN